MRKFVNILFGVFVVLCICGFIFSQKTEYATDTNGWNLIMVNDEYHVPQNYAVELTQLDNGERVDKRIYPALQEMFDAAEEDGVYMVVAEGYRTQEDQQELMDEKVQEYQEKVLLKFVAKWCAEKWVAVPGTSEHQLGIAVDINADGVHSAGSEVYAWLAEHAHEYGFIQRYPEDKTEITGINYEPWHYRYVGEDVAAEIYEEDICLEEYIEANFTN